MIFSNYFNTKDIKLMQVLPHLGSGGLVSGAIEIAEYIQSQGGSCVVVSSGGYREKDLRRTKCILEFLPVDTKNPFNILRNKKKIIYLIKRHNINLIHARSRAPAWSAYMAADKLKVPFITTFHGTYGVENYIKKKYNSVMLKGVATIAISEFIKNHIKKEYNKKDNIYVIPRGINEKIFNPQSVSHERLINLSKKLRTEEFRNVILMPGRLTEWKGHKYAIKALALLDKNNTNLIIVGDKQRKKNYKKSLINIAKSLKVQDKVLFVEHTRDLPAFLMLSDIVLSCSTKPEAFGRVILEAQAMGRPIIAFDHGGAIELIKNNENGILSPVGNVEKLAQNINKILNFNIIKRKALSKKSIASVNKNYLTKFMCQSTLKLYKRVLLNTK